MKNGNKKQKEKSLNIDRLISSDGKNVFDLKTGEFTLEERIQEQPKKISQLTADVIECGLIVSK
ncbi:hypothetical protein CIW83_18450 [Tissierella sp. P1]|uniref:hypothetical protein n=1 Tax=Tissierella sp. P1 TaxID=1280483 RepID=UPI000BA169C5|nr:hypothetical protein [Tissierella sp. P1]OZV10799.1 hypothetical protein CIW83_18450 [Tissierella sp. P1]